MMNRNDSKEFDDTLSKNNVIAQHPPWKITPSTKLDSHLHDGFDKTFNPPYTTTRVGGRNYVQTLSLV